MINVYVIPEVLHWLNAVLVASISFTDMFLFTDLPYDRWPHYFRWGWMIFTNFSLKRSERPSDSLSSGELNRMFDVRGHIMHYKFLGLKINQNYWSSVLIAQLVVRTSDCGSNTHICQQIFLSFFVAANIFYTFTFLLVHVITRIYQNMQVWNRPGRVPHFFVRKQDRKEVMCNMQNVMKNYMLSRNTRLSLKG
jgi:hypothetical protein